MRCVYKRPQGGRLLDERRHPEAIKGYLRAEARQIAQVAAGYEVLVEFGCSAGRYASLARRLGLRYVGVDKEAKYLRRARRRYPKVHLLKSTVDAALLHRLYPLYGGTRVLLVLPFNLLGILPDAAAFVESFSQTAGGWGLFISLFRTGREATNARSRYYASAGLCNLRRSGSETGVLFQAAGGFSSVAFSEHRMAQLLAAADVSAEYQPAGAIAAFYYKPSALLQG